MELRQLEYFVAVAEEANFTRAAKRVHISQSGVSAQIRQLEQDLGATLIDRSGRTASLTASGGAALEHARAALACADRLRRAVDEVTGLIRGQLVVGMISGCTVSGLFDALATFHLAHPSVQIVLVENSSEPLIDGVRTGDVDLALIGTAGAPPPDVEVLPLASERLVAAVPADHPLTKRKHISLADIIAYPVVCQPEGTAPRTMFDRACAARGIQPDIVMQASAPVAVADLAERGLGIAILPESTIAHHRGGLKGLSVDDMGALAGLALIWKTTQSPALRELILCSRRSFADPGSRQVIPAGGRKVQ